MRENRKRYGIRETLSRLSDWLLILIGAALVVKALLAVDVPLARTLIITAGTVFILAGLFYRHRRKR
ncbi:MAG: hypothetical protein Kow0089_09100 [Desulfobulbaceae bacterium]